jgi:predicted adenine nucleotide alpha hydrolase (AANH) superfamily ATPase
MNGCLLVHACCGHCAAALLEPLRRRAPFTLFWYNPNVMPLLEFRRRAKSLQVLADAERLDLLVDLTYDPKRFLGGVPWDRPERCEACYRLRLAETARLAAERGFEAITTTLLVSVHQDHEAVRRIGTEEAAARGLRFLYEDWRPLAERGPAEAKRRNLYRQQYCGCLFSEQERFAPTRRHLYRGEGGGEILHPEGDA